MINISSIIGYMVEVVTPYNNTLMYGNSENG